MSNPRSFRLDDTTIKGIDVIKGYLQNRYDHIADMAFVNPKLATNTDAVEFAIRLTIEQLKKEGIEIDF